MPAWSLIVIAYVADMFFGDPEWLPHPVRGIGWMITSLENVLRKKIKNEKVSGAVLAAIIIYSVWMISWLVLEGLGIIHNICADIAAVILIYTALSVKDLGVESMRVYNSLANNDIKAARKNLSMIVGRDTDNLDRSEIIRATVETVSENMVDGIIAPLFYAFIGGAPLALAYKAVNTLDSMIGYKNDKYKDFGFFAAKIDDIANFCPARITAVILPIAVLLVGKDGLNAAKIILRDRKNHASPNSGIPEAGVAGSLNIQLGGLNYYDGMPSEKALIGDAVNKLNIQHIKESLIINNVCALLVLVLGIVVMYKP